MRPGQPLSPAQFVDRFMTRTAIGVFLVSLAYGASVLERILGTGAAELFDKLSLALGIAAVIIVLPQFVQLIRRRKELGIGHDEPEGFITDVYKRAAERAFGLTFIFLLIMDVMTRGAFAGFPADVAIKLVIAVSLGIFSISFFVFNRVEETADDFDGESGR